MPVPAPIGRWSQAEVVAAQRIEHDADHLPASDQNTGHCGPLTRLPPDQHDGRDRIASGRGDESVMSDTDGPEHQFKHLIICRKSFDHGQALQLRNKKHIE